MTSVLQAAVSNARALRTNDWNELCSMLMNVGAKLPSYDSKTLFEHVQETLLNALENAEERLKQSPQDARSFALSTQPFHVTDLNSITCMASFLSSKFRLTRLACVSKIFNECTKLSFTNTELRAETQLAVSNLKHNKSLWTIERKNLLYFTYEKLQEHASHYSLQNISFAVLCECLCGQRQLLEAGMKIKKIKTSVRQCCIPHVPNCNHFKFLRYWHGASLIDFLAVCVTIDESCLQNFRSLSVVFSKGHSTDVILSRLEHESTARVLRQLTHVWIFFSPPRHARQRQEVLRAFLGHLKNLLYFGSSSSFFQLEENILMIPKTVVGLDIEFSAQGLVDSVTLAKQCPKLAEVSLRCLKLTEKLEILRDAFAAATDIDSVTQVVVGCSFVCGQEEVCRRRKFVSLCEKGRYRMERGCRVVVCDKLIEYLSEKTSCSFHSTRMPNPMMSDELWKDHMRDHTDFPKRSWFGNAKHIAYKLMS